MKRTLLFLAALLLCRAPAAQAQDIVAVYLDSAAVMVTAQGFEPMGEVVRGSLAAGQTREIELRPRARTRYVVIGVCDTACTDLDLALMNRRGLDVAADRAPDNVPVLSVLPNDSDRYYIRIEMAACAAAECDYAIQIFHAPASQ